ncbi:MAG: isocitrate lyase/PEP mutase family protein [Acidimicrobiia bacterium]
MRNRFRQLHETGTFVMPNPWDVGSAKLLASLGFPALATTSLGHAATLGRADGQVTRDELLVHVEALVKAVDVPINVDAERCFGDDAKEVARTARLLAATGAAGFSIEDWNPASGAIDPIDVATERVAAAAEVAGQEGMTLTARAENHVRGVDDLDDTIRRLISYRDAGAPVVYAPHLRGLDRIKRLVREVEVPVNVISLLDGPSVGELGAVGVRRVSTGGALSRGAFGALERAGLELLEQGTSSYLSTAISAADLTARFSNP